MRLVLPLIAHRSGADEVREKARDDIVTATDTRVQSLLQEALAGFQPEIAFVGEEGPLPSTENTRRTWLVDPICGTTNYAAGIPLFATNVALVEDGVTTIAAVADGATGRIYAAERDRGAWFVDSTKLVPLTAARGFGIVSIDPDHRGSSGLQRFPSDFALRAIERQSWDIRALSSTIALIYVATGRLAGAVYLTRGAALHSAAGALMVREAGAIATDETGADWSIGSSILVVAATEELHMELQSLAVQVHARLTGSKVSRL
jgi:myo-inositol-1(or 4)-monophosphatase